MAVPKSWRRVGLALGIAGLGLLALWLAMSRRAEAGVITVSQTTLADFNNGEFLRTGLADVGDGAVSLLRAGLSGEWITTVVTAGLTPRWGHSAVYTNGRIYVIGGLNHPNYPSAITATIIQSAHVLSDHNLTPWSTLSTNLTTIFTKGTAYGGAVLVGDFLYVIGGQREPSIDFEVAQPHVAYARVNPDGALSPFTPTAPLPIGLAQMAVAAWDGWIYVLGGIDANLQITSTIYVAHPDPATGAITGWTSLTWTLPYPLYRHAAIAEQGYLYVIGGMTQPTGIPLYEVWFAPLGPGTLQGPFTRTASLDNNLVELAAIGYNGLLLTSGGLQSNLSDPSQDVRAGVTAEGGGVITWTATSLITPPRSAHAMVVLPDGWVYVIGGRGRIQNQDVPLTHINAGRLGADGLGLFVSSGRYVAPPFRLDRRRLMVALRLHLLRPDSTDISVRYRTQPQDGFPWNDWSEWMSITSTGELTVSIPIQAYVQALQYELTMSTSNPLTAPFLLNADLLYEMPDQPPSFVKSSTPPSDTSVRPGERITYTVTLTNDSGATLHGVRLEDTFPSGTVYVPESASASPGLLLTVSANGLVGEIDALTQGQVLTFTFAVTVSAPSGEVQNQATLQTDEFGLLRSNTTRHPIAALTGSLSTSPPEGSIVLPGSWITYTVRITNPADLSATNVEISGHMPIPVMIGAIQASAGSVITDAWPMIRWTVGSVDPNTSAALTLSVRITDPMYIADGTLLTATASFSGAVPLPIGTITHLVRQPYTIEVSKTDEKAHADIGEILRYTITLTNTGWVTVTDVWITDTLIGWPWIVFPEAPDLAQWVTMGLTLGPRAVVSLTRDAQIDISANISDVVAFTNTVEVRSAGGAGFPLADHFEARDRTDLLGPDLVGTILPNSVQYEDRGITKAITFTLIMTNVGPGTARPLSGTLGCAPWWVLVGFKINGKEAASDYLGLPSRQLKPGESVTVPFTLTISTTEPISTLGAVIDVPIPGYGDSARGCVMETNEDNNATPEVWIAGFRVFLPLVLRNW
ncbi:MAG TPA: kelch repeat-containing protein [Thermoflexus sp.]|nr:kelch repeat-containing protein [Thermoflexus sp.]